ncbi:hypothetical protein MSG28_006258 [Choristoneura fumiferana]|uniref:Uncharacterized protein n=1 Tax=Choristoneura fumiferana TaxID=7141 RepID=A0ACC0JEA2_CHOFU|nr:hypothetical protein MSG28_006258 [Choristoneura fumiferana]
MLLLTIAAFTVERYLAVSRPFLRHRLSLKSRVYKIIALNWIISCCFGIPDYFLIGIIQKEEQTYCHLKTPDKLKILIGMEMFVFFIMPTTIIFVLYVLIAIKIKSIDMLHKNSPVSGKQYRDKTIKMLELEKYSKDSTCIYFSSSAEDDEEREIPIKLYSAGLFSFNSIKIYVAWRILRYLCLVNAYIYTAVNPILYSLMSRKFSRAFKVLKIILVQVNVRKKSSGWLVEGIRLCICQLTSQWRDGRARAPTFLIGSYASSRVPHCSAASLVRISLTAQVVGPCARSARIATTILLANPAVKQQCLHCCVSAWRNGHAPPRTDSSYPTPQAQIAGKLQERSRVRNAMLLNDGRTLCKGYHHLARLSCRKAAVLALLYFGVERHSATIEFSILDDNNEAVSCLRPTFARGFARVEFGYRTLFPAVLWRAMEEACVQQWTAVG